MRRSNVFIVAVLLMLPLMPAVFGQAQLISGTVVDQSGGVLPGATVQVIDQNKSSLVRELVTDEAGRFQALNIQPGLYTIKVEMTGFQTLNLSDVKLDVNNKMDIGKLTMKVGEVATVVSVTGEIPAVQTNTMEKSFFVEQKQVAELPMNGRNWTALMRTVPGVTMGNRSNLDLTFNDASQMHVGGGRGSQNNFYLDGTPNLDVGDNQSQYTQPSIDSVAEFRVQMSTFNAEYGRNSGMVVAVQTKSGGSDFHGSLYEYARNDWFDAVNPAKYRRQPTDPPNKREKDILNRHQFGGNISGWIPFPKLSTSDTKRLFFFYNREMTRQLQSGAGSAYTDLPGPGILGGDFRDMLLDTNMQYAPQFKNGTIFQPGSVKRDGAGNIIDGVPMPNNTIPQSQWVAASANYLKLFKPPFMPDLASLPDAPRKGFKRYYYISPNKFNKDQDLLRIDYMINDNTTSYFRWVNDDQWERLAGAIWGSQPFPIAPQERPKPGSSWSWSLIKAFTPKVSSETILAYMHQSQELRPMDPESVSMTGVGVSYQQLYPLSNRYGIVPNFNAGNNIRMDWGDPGWHNDGKDYSVTENVSWFTGAHTMKFGFHYNRDNKKQTGTWPIQGSIDFQPGSVMKENDTNNGISNMMLGLYRTYSQASAHIYPYFRFQSWEAFAQDSWKMSPRFTMEYGIRFQRTTPTYTYKRKDGVAGVDEGTFDTWSVDISKYDRSKAPVINLGTGRFDSNPLNALLANGLVNDLMPGVPRGFADTLNLFAPRVGFAYDLTGDGKTSLRAGAGIFYERLRQNNFNFGAGGRFPSAVTSSVGPGPVTDIRTITNTAEPTNVAPPGYNVFPKDNTMPHVYSWNLGIQRELKSGFTLDVSYMGNAGNYLMVQRAINGLPAGYFLQNPDASKNVNYRNDALRQYYGFGGLTAVETSGLSEYHGFLARLSRRFSNSFSMNINYTWSKAFGEVDNDDGNISNPFCRHCNWAPQSYDRTHVFVLDYIYQLPALSQKLGGNAVLGGVLDNWQISGITEFSTGLPTTINSNGGMYGLDLQTQRAIVVGDYKAKRSQGIWFDPDAFQRPQDATWGLGRNSFRFPGVNNWDVVIQKFFPLGINEQSKLNLRVEMYNFFNHTQVWTVGTGFAGDNPGSGISANNRGSFGIPNGFRDPRTLQVGLKVTF
ncbi:MAG: hypothetical protein EHM61_19475 [Acidobacteria bacterium]|nr:MAG: hypothetical protein EHM61_19475 [Acidobacteriota bacterium]